MSLSPAFLEALRIETAVLQAKHPVLADVLSRANALLGPAHMTQDIYGKKYFPTPLNRCR